MQFLASFATGLACFAGIASAYHAPTGSEPVGNPFSAPGLGSVVPAGQEFAVTWQPTTNGTVTILLLQGPAKNLQVVGPIAEGIPNSGNFDWTPASNLAPGKTGYGLQLIDDSTGAYQYTTQFGISNSDYSSSSSSSSVATSAAATKSSSYPTSTASGASTTASVQTTTLVTVITAAGQSTVGAPVSHTSAAAYSSYPTASSSVASSGGNSSTGSSSPSALPTTATSGANGLATSFAGLVIAAGVAIFVL